MLEQLADHDDELARAIADGRDAEPREGAPGPRPRNRRKPRRVRPVRIGDQLLGRSPPAESAAPRSARPAVGRGTPARRHDPALYVFKISHGIGRPARLARVLGGQDRRRLRPQDRRTATIARARRRCSRSRARRPRRSARRSAGDVVAVAKVDAVKAGQWLGSGKVPPHDRNRLSGTQLRVRHRARRPQGRRQAVRSAAAADWRRMPGSSSSMTRPTTKSASKASTTSI